MPIPKVDGKPQISLDDFVYGALPIAGMPTLSGGHNIAYWDEFTSQWYPTTIVGAGQADINWDSGSHVLEIYFGPGRIPDDFTADSIILSTVSALFPADAWFLRVVDSTFTADAVLI